MLRIGVLVSGGGTNLQAILDRIQDGYLKECSVVTVISSRKGAYAIERANAYSIPATVISKKDYKDFDKYTDAMLDHIQSYNVDLIVLAGFLSMVGEKIADIYRNRIINIHPSLIPAFCGKGFYGIVPHVKALEYGVKITGATVHFIDAQYDSGPVILQKAVEIREDDTPEILQQRVMEEAEWIILPEAIKLFAENKISVDGRKVYVKR